MLIKRGDAKILDVVKESEVQKNNSEVHEAFAAAKTDAVVKEVEEELSAKLKTRLEN